MKPIIHLHDNRWKKALRPYCKTIQGIILSVAQSAESKDLLSVVLTNDTEIRALNKQFRGKDKPTNVLSFPNDDEPLGDVILAYDTIEREANEQGKTFHDHASHLIIHGVLHLLGYDHEHGKDAQKMEALEIKILKKLGIENPYL